MMRRRPARGIAPLLAVALLLVSLPSPCRGAEHDTAEGETGSAATLPSLEERIRRLRGIEAAADEDLALPRAPDPRGLSEDTARQYQQTLQAYYAYRRSGYEHRLAVFEWQFFSTRAIFVVVLVLVFAGIYFAAIQFHHGLRSSDKTRQGNADESTEFVFSLREFKVRSPVLGVIVLTISLAFFYLYLVYVYPIENVF